jgi:hypothetical protein
MNGDFARSTPTMLWYGSAMKMQTAKVMWRQRMMNKESSSGMSKKEWMRDLREHGFKYHEIAEIVGVSRQYVASVCGKGDPAYFRTVGEHCVYPNIRN